MTIRALYQVQEALEDAYFMTDLEMLPLTSAVQDGDTVRIEQNLAASTLGKNDIGESIVEAAKGFDTTNLQLLLSSPKVAEVDPEFIGRAIWFADGQAGLILLLELPQARLLPVGSLEMAFSRCCALGYTKPFKKLIQMPAIVNAEAKEVYLFTNMLALVESNAFKEVNLFLNSRLATKLKPAEFSDLYLKALEKGHCKIAKVIQKFATRLTHPEFALLFAAKYNNQRAVTHLTTAYLIHCDYLIGAIRLAERYGHPQIIEILFPQLHMHQITELGKAILTYTLWANCCRKPDRMLPFLPKLMNTDISNFCADLFDKQRVAAAKDLMEIVQKALNNGEKFASIKFQYMELIDNKMDTSNFTESGRNSKIIM